MCWSWDARSAWRTAFAERSNCLHRIRCLSEAGDARLPVGGFVARENPDRYIEIGPDSRVEGYAIVDGEGRPDVKRANYRQDRTAVLRGLLWVDGAAQVQGIVSGCMAANRLVYSSPEGYYEDMLYDLTLLENPAAAYPLWAAAAYRRKEAGWVR